jgi:glutamate/tyrosine decarboxylase-like PLP-dependent enzyme
MPGPRYFGFVIGGTLPAALAAHWLACTWDQNTAHYCVAPTTSHLEQLAFTWLLDVLQLPPTAKGAFVTGATVANLCALAAARHTLLKRAGWNVEADGLFGAPLITVIVGEEVHPTVIKALGILGLGRNRVVKIPTDSQGRLRAELLPPITGPTLIIAQAGNVNTGAFDPLAAICRHAHVAENAWVHIDGAFGLWAAASPQLQPLIAGHAEADSWATDAHKWLNVPYDCGLAFVRDPSSMQAAMSITAAYLPNTGTMRNPGDFTPELSRRARGVDVWAALHSLGRSGLAALIDRTCALARRFASQLAAAGLEILNDVVLNQVLVTFGDAERTLRVVAAIQADGTCWAGSTVWQGRTAMRISVSCWATTEADVDLTIAAILRIHASL